MWQTVTRHFRAKTLRSVGTFLYQYWYVLWTVCHQCRYVPIQMATEVTHWKSINTHGTTINCTRGLMRGMATLPKVTRSISGQRKSWKTPGELGVSKSMECDIFPSVLWHCWLGDRKGIRPVKKLDVGLLVVTIWLELCTTYSSKSPVVTTHHLQHPLLQ